MAKYTIGITEAGDAGVDLSWEDKLEKVDGAIVITKNVSPDFRHAVLQNADKLIVHATVTGFGCSVLEPNVPTLMESVVRILALAQGGVFPKEKITIRVDPIIPTEKGLNTALNVIETFMREGFSRYRISVIDMYPHVRDRFRKVGLPLPYGEKMFAGKEQMETVDAMILEAKAFWENQGNRPGDLRVESCAEPYLKETIPCGCISAYDLELLGMDPNEADSFGGQRTHCMCYSGKKELLTGRHPCRHNCRYCYWKNV